MRRFVGFVLLLLVTSACTLLLPVDGLGTDGAQRAPDAREDAEADARAPTVTDAADEIQRDGPREVSAPDGSIVWSGNGHAYLLVNTDLISWTVAQEEARLAGGHLVTITSAEEQAFVRTNLLADAGTLVWVGAFQQPDGGADEPDKKWRWVTDEPWSYTHWQIGQPNDTSGDENYAVTYAGDYWNDIEENGGSAVDTYIVEFE